MIYANDRAHGIALLRAWARKDASDKGLRGAHLGLITAMDALLEEFRVEFDLPGTRYWYHPESDAYFSTVPEQYFANIREIGDWAQSCIELSRAEFLGRQGLHFGYEDRL